MANALKKITAEAKRLQKKHPNAKWTNLVKQAGAKYRAGTLGASVTRKKAVGKKKTATHKRKKARTSRKKPVITVVRVMGKRKPRKKAHSKKVGGYRPTKTVKYRQVGRRSGGSMMPLLVLGAVAIAGVMLFKANKPATTLPAGTPPLVLTTNQTRNTQSQDIIAYAMAGGLAIDSIIKLIQALNNSTDKDVQDIYNYKETTGGLPDNIFA